MQKLSFSTTGCWNLVEGFGCASLGLAGICDNSVERIVTYERALKGKVLSGSYTEILERAETIAAVEQVYAAIVVFGNVGGENTFLAKLQRIVPCPMVGGGAAIDAASGRSGLIPGSGEAAVLLITDDRFTYTVSAKCIHTTILEECRLTLSDPRTVLQINGVDAAEYLAQKRKLLGIQDTDFEHLTLSDMNHVNAHLSCVDGVIKSGRDLCENMLLRYIPHADVYGSIRSFYDDPDAIVFGCAGLGGILDKPLDTSSLGLFLFGEVCTVDGVVEFGNLMLSKLIISPKGQ